MAQAIPRHNGPSAPVYLAYESARVTCAKIININGGDQNVKSMHDGLGEVKSTREGLDQGTIGQRMGHVWLTLDT
jgi:hypothetical protein